MSSDANKPNDPDKSAWGWIVKNILIPLLVAMIPAYATLVVAHVLPNPFPNSPTPTPTLLNQGVTPVETSPSNLLPIYTPTMQSTSIWPSNSTPLSTTPSISFIKVPSKGSNAQISGIAERVDAKKYGVAVYIYVDGGWWTRPDITHPITSLASDGTWSVVYATNNDDLNATQIAAYLIPIGYNPPPMTGGATLPFDLIINAVAKTEATR